MKAIPVEFLEKARMAYVDANADPEDLAYVKGWNDALAAMVENGPKAEAPEWISVKDRPPESGVHVLACCRFKSFGGKITGSYVCDAFYAAPKTETCSWDDEIDMVYDEEKDEYFMPEGWWEVIKNWDEYSCVAIEDTVTHWMPKPDVPEVEE